MQLSADVTVTGHELGHYRRRGRSRRHRQTQRGTPVWKTSICHLLRFQINQPARAPRTSNELEDRSTGERGERERKTTQKQTKRSEERKQKSKALFRRGRHKTADFIRLLQSRLPSLLTAESGLCVTERQLTHKHTNTQESA